MTLKLTYLVTSVHFRLPIKSSFMNAYTNAKNAATVITIKNPIQLILLSPF